MRVDVLSVFPEYFGVLDLSLIGKARERGLLEVVVHDPRDFAHDRHRTVDDTPYGGGAGMVMRPEPWGEALDHVVGEGGRAVGRNTAPRLLVPTPAGRLLTQQLAQELADEPWLVVACGRYEGFDQRVIEDAGTRMRVDEVSLGDYVLNGGEVAALAIIEAVARLLPGVVGNPGSLAEESHSAGLLEAPAYTKPATWRDREVPPVLQSGHHARVVRWRREQSLRRTARVRPDLVEILDPTTCDQADLALLAELGWRPTPEGFIRGFPPAPDAVAD
jgi:tRNA (guanine37-N1)-methyltransferase